MIPKARLRIAIIVASLLLLTLVTMIGRVPLNRGKTLVYNGKSFESIFYGNRTNIFIRDNPEGRLAILSFGTNAFHFLYENIKGMRGCGVLYYKMYRTSPTWVQAKLRYPILSEDLKKYSWEYVGWMHDLSKEQVQQLCVCVLETKNPRLRLCSLNSLAEFYGTYPDFFALCKKLLDDPHPGIRLKATIRLAQRAKQFQGPEPRLFPILAEGLTSKQTRASLINDSCYKFGQVPPGGTNGLSRAFLDEMDVALRIEIMEAINGLRVVTPKETEQLREIFAKRDDH